MNAQANKASNLQKELARAIKQEESSCSIISHVLFHSIGENSGRGGADSLAAV